MGKLDSEGAFVLSATIVGVGLSLGCGARTALEEPRVIPLHREPPAVAFLVAWHASCDDSLETCPPDELYAGRDHYDAARFAIAHMLRVLEESRAMVGAMPSQTIRYGVDGPEAVAPDWPDADSPGWCFTPGDLVIPISAGNGPQIEEYFSRANWPAAERANGAGAFLPNVPIVEQALIDAGNEHTSRLLVLIDTGRRGDCDQGLDRIYSPRLVPNDDDRYGLIREFFAALEATGIRTLVVGLTETVPPRFVRTQRELQALNAEADGGGLARPADDPRDSVLWYDYSDATSIETVLRREVVTPYWCTLYSREPIPEDLSVALVSTTGAEAPPRDESRLDGWDFLDEQRTVVGLFGPACERAAVDGVSLTFVVD